MYSRVHVCRYFRKSSKTCWTVLLGGKGGRGSSYGDTVCLGRRYSLNLVPRRDQKRIFRDMIGRSTIRPCSNFLPSPARMCCLGAPLLPQHERIHCYHNRSRRVFWHPPRLFLALGNWENIRRSDDVSQPDVLPIHALGDRDNARVQNAIRNTTERCPDIHGHN